ncbi:auxin-induced in root cultures-like protein [Tasmannia lanceolata]|uniref:auxin-induced in root cultures-like protein n=1 Tax=Tasmannia lanceolata TaxID=3420 RepID=UPI0040648187
MASSRFSSMTTIIPFTILSLIILTPLPSLSATTCSSQTFSNNRLFQSCNNLPTLNSSLHWTYNSSNSSLNLAFIAPPTSPNGWISWGINPIKPAMIGTQALIAYRQSNSSMIVKTFNISSYSVMPSPISFQVSNMEAEFSNGLMTIFATFTLPNNMMSLNQVWQVGSAMNGTIPVKHAFAPENLQSVGKLDVSGSGGEAPVDSPSPSSTPASVSPPQSFASSLTRPLSFSSLFLFGTALITL